MDDLISRKKAIDRMEWYDEEEYMHPGYIKTEHAIKILEGLPPAHTKRQYVIKMNKSTENDIIEKFKKFGKVPAVLAPANWEISRVCDICGRGTGDIDKHICNECRERLQKILYRSQGGYKMKRKMEIIVKHPNGYSGMIFGESSLAVFDNRMHEIIHTGDRNIETAEDLYDMLEDIPGICRNDVKN